MPLAAQIVAQQVSGIIERHSDDFTNELRPGTDEQKIRSAAFVFLVATTTFELTDQETLDGIVDGGNDFGVDALYFGPPNDGELPIALIQGKYRRDLRRDAAFPEHSIARIIDAISALFDPGEPVTLNTRLSQRVEDIRSFVKDGAIPRVTVVAANNGTGWTAQAQQRIDNASREFGELVEWRHIGPEQLLALLQARKPIGTELQFAGHATVETFDFRRVLTGRMSVAELARLTDTYDNQLFERNIRRYLGLAGNRVNEAVAATLRSQDQRSNFYFYNNGITITCSQFRQQDDTELVEAITFATNSQNPVDLRDLRANDQRQQDLGTSIAGLGYTYRTKREDRPVSSAEFTSAVIAEAVLAIWRHRPHQARFNAREHFGALYPVIFTRDLNGAQAIIAALLLRHAENRRKRPPDDAPDFLAYGSRFVAMLMGRYLLADLGIELDHLDHRNFVRARELVDRQSQRYLLRAENEIENALALVLSGRDRTLQRLSATFRRADLVDELLSFGDA